MDTTEKIPTVLNDLIKINNYWVAGFEKASENLENDYLEPGQILDKLAGESRENVAELAFRSRQYYDEPDGSTNVYCSLHRAQLDVKSTVTGNGLESILNECARGENAIEQAYNSALKKLRELP